MIHTGDCIEVMRGMEADSVDAIVTDPPYGLEFMGKRWDAFKSPGRGARVRTERAAEMTPVGKGHTTSAGPFLAAGIDQYVAGHPFQEWCEAWGREALRVTKPGGYLLAFGGTRTHHRLVCGLEDAGWIIRDELDWIYASGFPKGKANLKPAHEPIVMARKPGPLRPLNIDGCRIGTGNDRANGGPRPDRQGDPEWRMSSKGERPSGGRWPSNVLLSDPELFDQPLDDLGYGGSGGYSRFFIVPKADGRDREPSVSRLHAHASADVTPTIGDPHTPVSAWPGVTSPPSAALSKDSRVNVHPTVKPVDLMRHLVRLVTPSGGTVLDPFLGSGSTAIACELEGFPWIGIEREPEYVAIAEARLNGTQRGFGLEVPA